MADEIRSLLLLKPGESLGIGLEPLGRNSAVEPGKYIVVCNTKSGEQWNLVSDVEIRPEQRTIVHPQALIGKVRIDALTPPRLPHAHACPTGESW